MFPHLSFTVEAKDLKADTRRASRLDLMQMSEKVKPRSSPPIVQLTLCQNTQQSGLARVHITKYSYPQVQELQEKHKEWAVINTNERIKNKRTTTRKKNASTVALLTCWSSGTLRMRTSAILRGTSES